MIKQDECIFCKIAKKEIPVEVIFETENFICFPDADPVVKGHSLIITKKHFMNIMELPSDLGKELINVIKKLGEIKLKECFSGFNLIMNNFPEAGQIVMHAHIHLLPRKKGDGVKVLG
ncbi:MAG: HIT family protein [Nanoarchaeota archaeon]|nr:HIT family protein [Nanoarchaeota archaeon]